METHTTKVTETVTVKDGKVDRSQDVEVDGKAQPPGADRQRDGTDGPNPRKP